MSLSNSIEVNSHKWGKLISDKGAKTLEQRTVLATNDTGKIGYLYTNNWNLA